MSSSLSCLLLSSFHRPLSHQHPEGIPHVCLSLFTLLLPRLLLLPRPLPRQMLDKHCHFLCETVPIAPATPPRLPADLTQQLHCADPTARHLLQHLLITQIFLLDSPRGASLIAITEVLSRSSGSLMEDSCIAA